MAAKNYINLNGGYKINQKFVKEFNLLNANLLKTRRNLNSTELVHEFYKTPLCCG